jgi:hypothetical protein
MKIWSVTSASNQDASQLERIRRFGKVRPSDQRIKTSGGALPEVAELLILKMLSVTSLVKMDRCGHYRDMCRGRSQPWRFKQQLQ